MNRTHARQQLLGWCVLTVVTTVVLLVQQPRRGLLPRMGLDFQIYWNAGRLADGGLDPYQPYYKGLGFVYPPFALLPFQALARISLARAEMVWLAADAAILAALICLAISRRPSLRAQESRSIITTATTTGIGAAIVMVNGYTYRCVMMGQVGLLLVGLVAFDLIAVRDRPLAGILTGVAMGIKFTPAVFLIYFVARRRWRAAATALTAFIATIVIGALVDPRVSWRYWHALLVVHRLGTGVPSQYGAVNNQSLTNAIVMLGGSTHDVTLGRGVALLVCLITLAGGAIIARHDRPWLGIGVLGVASCVAPGSAWDHHYVWLVAAVFALTSGELRHLPITAGTAILWAAWATSRGWLALVGTPITHLSGLQHAQAVATPLLAALFAITASLEACHAARSPRAPHAGAGSDRTH